MATAIRLLSLIISLTALSAVAAKKAKPASAVTLNQIVDKLQDVWDKTHSYQTEFKQVVFAKRLGTRDESEGTLYVIKPDKLRWESKTDGSIQIMNGRKLILIEENRRRGTRTVDIYKDVAKAVDAKPLKFLAGKAKFRDVYSIMLISDTESGAELKLIPKDDSTESLIAEIDKSSYLLRSLTTDSPDSRVRVDFSGIKTNIEISHEQFEYKSSPKDVVTNQ
jgi:outer membrane lipoprotein-sorting protein